MAVNDPITSQFVALRDLARVSIQEAADAAKVSYATLWNFENGHRKLKETQLKLLRDFYLEKFNERFQSIVKLLEPEKS